MNKVLLFALSACMTLFFSSAGVGGQSVEALVEALNAQLAKVPIEGYQSGRNASMEEWNKMVLIAVPIVKDVLPKIPAGYVLQVTGHTDSAGGVDSKQNITLSNQRAMQVWTALKTKYGISSSKMTCKGVAATIKTDKCPIDNACQRRVTFIVVPK
jgi:flagellar motor protein MotB